MILTGILNANGISGLIRLDKRWCIQLIFDKADFQLCRAMDSSTAQTADSHEGWPKFLDLLDTDRQTAWEQFYVYGRSLFLKFPPSCLLSLDRDEQQEVMDRILEHCRNDDFRVLRTYRNTGRRFSGWLYSIAFNYAIDYLRAKARRRRIEAGLNHDPAPPESPDTQQADRPIRLREVYRLAREAMRKLDRRCQLLLSLAADELTPKEMLPFLQEAGTNNVKVSNDLRYCRKKLRDLLSVQGCDIEVELGQ